MFGPAVFSIAMLVATLSPLVREADDDGFPLSTYPMFAHRRARVQTLDYVLGETSRGERRTLDTAVTGTSEVLQALAMIERAVGAGSVERQQVCQAIAARVAAESAFDEVAMVRIVTGRHDAIDFVLHGQIGREAERARCPVPR